jgi:tetratricopeptide (TPR) repeat protein
MSLLFSIGWSMPLYAISKHHQLGLAAMQKNDFEDAAIWLNMAVSSFGEDRLNPAAHYHLGLCHQHRGQYQNAEYALKDALRLNPHDPHTLAALGFNYDKMKFYDLAIDSYSKIKPGEEPYTFAQSEIQKLRKYVPVITERLSEKRVRVL